jgi:hypothetical protein
MDLREKECKKQRIMELAKNFMRAVKCKMIKVSFCSTN